MRKNWYGKICQSELWSGEKNHNGYFAHHVIQAGVPRAGYRGVVSFMRNNRRVYLAPPPTWNGYDPKWNWYIYTVILVRVYCVHMDVFTWLNAWIDWPSTLSKQSNFCDTVQGFISWEQLLGVAEMALPHSVAWFAMSMCEKNWWCFGVNVIWLPLAESNLELADLILLDGMLG